MTESATTSEKDCSCNCDCCREEKTKSKPSSFGEAISQVHVNDTVGATFLGTLAVLLLIFLVRSNKRNRELLLEVIELRRQV